MIVEYLSVIKNRIKLLTQQGAVHILVGNFVNRFVNLLGTICLVRILSVQEYGVLTYAENIYSFIYILVGAGLNNAVIRYVLLEEDIGEKKAVYNYIILRGTLYNSVIVLAGMLFNLIYPHPTGFKDAELLIYCLLFAMPFAYLIEVVLSNERAFFDNKSYAYISVLTGCFIIVGKIVGAFTFGAKGTVAMLFFAELILSIIFLNYERKKYYNINSIKKISRALKKKINVYGLQYMCTNGLWAIFLLMDIFLLATITGDEVVVAEYKVAYTIPACLSIISGAIGIFVGPYFIKNENNIEWIRRNFKICFAVTLAIVFSVALFVTLLSKQIILLLYGEEYLQIKNLMNLLLIAAVANAGLRFTTANILSAMGKVKYNMLISGAALILQISLNLIMIDKFGATGAAITSIGVYLFMAIALFVIFNNKYKVFLYSKEINI